MSKKRLIVLSLILIIGTSNFPKITYEGDILQWIRIYGSKDTSESIGSIIQTFDGGYALLGSTSYSGTPSEDVWLMKTDEYGKVQWTQPINGWGFVMQTVEGGFLLAGKRGGRWVREGSDAWLMKLDAQGRPQWDQTYNLQDRDTVTFITQTMDGGLIIGGNTFSFEKGESSWLGKANAKGDLEWQQVYDGVEGSKIIQTVDGGFAFVGTQHSGNDWIDDGVLVKTDAKGIVQWNHTYSNPTSSDRGTSIIQTTDGGFVFAGRTITSGWTYHVWFVKTGAHGVRQWNQTYEYESHSTISSVFFLTQTVDSGFAFAGRTLSNAEGDTDTWLIKIEATGNIEGTRINGPHRDFLTSAIPIVDGGFAFSGDTNSYGMGGIDGWLIKIDSQGVVQWNQTYGGPMHDDINAMIQTADGGFVLAGSTNSYGTGSRDAWVVKTDDQGNAPELDIKPSNQNILILIVIVVFVIFITLGIRKWRR